jgi:hypothetical protein
MKAEVIEKEEKQEKSKYPYLGVSKHDGDIVFFSDSETGMCIASKNKSRIGQYLAKGSTSWDEDYFKKLNGKVILEND